MLTALAFSLGVLQAPPSDTHAHALWPTGLRERRPVMRLSAALASDPSFEPVDELDHQDDFWQSSLVGDADHDGRAEIILRHVPIGGGENRIVFYEDDRLGQFDEVFSFPLADGGLLAIGDVDQDGLTDLFLERAVGFCNHEFFRMESSSPSGFPDHQVWKSTKEGNVVDFRGFLADADGDGTQEFITGDSNFTCLPTTLKVFESIAGNQMKLILNTRIGSDLGNPVVADFDLDGKREIAVADFSQVLFVFEATGDDSFRLASTTPHSLFNAYQVALIARASPDERPMLFLAGQMGSLDYRVQVYEALENDSLTQINQAFVPNNCGASIPQIYAADVIGSRVPEIVLDRLCDPVPIFRVGRRGALALVDVPNVVESLEVVATDKTSLHSGAIAVGTFPTALNPEGKTIVLEDQP